MTEPREDRGLGDLVCALTEGLPAEQKRLYDEYGARLRTLEPLLDEAAARGWPELAQLAAGTPLALHQVTIEAGFRVKRRRERAFAIGVELINLGYRRKYAYSAFTENRLTVTVERAHSLPPEPSEME